MKGGDETAISVKTSQEWQKQVQGPWGEGILVVLEELGKDRWGAYVDKVSKDLGGMTMFWQEEQAH